MTLPPFDHAMWRRQFEAAPLAAFKVARLQEASDYLISLSEMPDLAPHEAVMAAIAEAIGLRQSPEQPAGQRLKALLRALDCEARLFGLMRFAF